MKSKKSLYEVLGLTHHAQVAEVRAAYRREVDALEAERGTLNAQDFDDRMQLLKIAHSTLSDPASRMVYDADLEAAARTALPAVQSPNSASARADALGLRADALALRAEAILARAEADGGYRRSGVGEGFFASTGRIAIMFVLVMMTLFGLSRCNQVRVEKLEQQREALHKEASEKAALQDYYQTYGVRPANIAEMELMEAERRRQENAERQLASDRRRAEEAQRRFEQESHRIGEQVSSNRIRAEEDARESRQRMRFEAESLALEISETTDDRTRRRLELQLRQLKERMRE